MNARRKKTTMRNTRPDLGPDTGYQQFISFLPLHKKSTRKNQDIHAFKVKKGNRRFKGLLQPASDKLRNKKTVTYPYTLKNTSKNTIAKCSSPAFLRYRLSSTSIGLHTWSMFFDAAITRVLRRSATLDSLLVAFVLSSPAASAALPPSVFPPP